MQSPLDDLERGEKNWCKHGIAWIAWLVPNLLDRQLGGNWLLAGTCFTYLHIALLPELDRLMISSYA